MAGIPDLMAADRHVRGPSARRPHRARRRALPWLLPAGALAIGASVALAAAPADAGAATYVARPDDGGRVKLVVRRDRLVEAEVRLPAHCENNLGGSWNVRLEISLSGELVLRSGRFDITGQAPNEVSYDFSGRRRGGAIKGRVRLTFLDLDYVGVDESYLCDTDMTRYRAVRRR